MKNLNEIKPDKIINGINYYSEYTLRKHALFNISDILKHNPDINPEYIKIVGILESGKLQFKVPETIKNRQVIILLAFLKWFFGL